MHQGAGPGTELASGVGCRPVKRGMESLNPDFPIICYAVFPGEGTNQSIQELERRIVTEWLPTSGYEYANAPDVEVYLNPDPDNAKYEVWIPVVKRPG